MSKTTRALRAITAPLVLGVAFTGFAISGQATASAAGPVTPTFSAVATWNPAATGEVKVTVSYDEAALTDSVSWSVDVNGEPYYDDRHPGTFSWYPQGTEVPPCSITVDFASSDSNVLAWVSGEKVSVDNCTPPDPDPEPTATTPAPDPDPTTPAPEPTESTTPSPDPTTDPTDPPTTEPTDPPTTDPGTDPEPTTKTLTFRVVTYYAHTIRERNKIRSLDNDGKILPGEEKGVGKIRVSNVTVTVPVGASFQTICKEINKVSGRMSVKYGYHIQGSLKKRDKVSIAWTDSGLFYARSGSPRM